MNLESESSQSEKDSYNDPMRRWNSIRKTYPQPEKKETNQKTDPKIQRTNQPVVARREVGGGKGERSDGENKEYAYLEER